MFLSLNHNSVELLTLGARIAALNGKMASLDDFNDALYSNLDDKLRLVAMLEFTLNSQNLESSDYLPLLEFVPDLCYEHQGSYTSLQELFYEISSRVLALACRNKDATADLVEHLCEWIKLFFQSILDNPTNEHFCTLLIAALQGIFQSFNSGNVSVLENFGPMFSQSMEQIIACPDALSNMSRELKISNLAERHDIPSFYTYVFEAMKNMVINFISPQATFTSVWEDLLLMKQNLRPILQEFLPVLSSLSSLTWNQDKKAIVCDQGDALFPELTVNMIHTSVLCSVLIEDGWIFLLEHIPPCIDDLNTFQSFSLDIFVACIEGLGVIGNCNIPAQGKVADILTIFLLDPADIFTSDDDYNCSILRECAGQTLGVVLAGLSENGNDSARKKSTLFACINSMHNTNSESANASKDEITLTRRKYENSISTIANLTRVLNSKDTIEIAIPALVRKLSETNDESKNLIWHALGCIGMTEDADIFRSVISFTLSSTKNFEKISKISHTLARMPGRPLPLLEIYLLQLLTKFTEQALMVQKFPDDQSHLSDLKDLVNLIRVLCEHENISSELLLAKNLDIVHQLRNMWFYLVLLVLTPSGWPKDWYGILKVIARKSPPLLLKKKERSLIVNLSADSILIATFSDSITNKIKPILTSYVPLKVNEVRNIPWSIAVYLVTVYQIERLRMKELSLDFLCGYLADDRLHLPDIYPIVEAIAESILKQAIRDHSYRKLPETVVEQHLQTLLVYAACRTQKIRFFVSGWIKRILNVVPRMLYHRKSVTYMLDILRYLDNEIANYKEPHLSFLESTIVFINAAETNGAASDYYKVCNDWLTSALKISNSETIAILQQYVAEISSKSPWINQTQSNFQTSLLKESNGNSLLMRLFQTYFENRSMSSVLIQHSSKRVRYIGEIQGMIETLGSAQSEPFDYDLNLQKTVQLLRRQLKATYREHDSPNFINDLHICLSKCAAYVVSMDQYTAELIQLICFAPKVKFSTTVLEITTETLSWIMSSKPQTAASILGHLNQVWETIATLKLGIYDSDEQALDPFTQAMTYGTPKPMPGKSFSSRAHTIWIEFLVERFKFDRLQETDSISLYTDFILNACLPNFPMSTCFKSYEARLDLASLGVRIAKELQRREDYATLPVWSAVLKLCMQFFRTSPLYGELTRIEFAKMIGFYNAIKSLKFEKINSMATNNLLKSSYTVGFESDRIEFSDIQQVLVVLWENEIHRFSAWFKPLQTTDVNSEFVLPPVVNERQLKWNSLLRIAWKVDPTVAIRFRTRFFNSTDIIDTEIADISRFSEIKAIDCPAGVSILLKNSWKSRVDNQLRHLMYWTPVPPITAIQLLSQTQKLQPWVIQYAIRSLNHFGLKDIVFFYIPQLVQALRTDTLGYIERFILEAAKTSQFFAHQIIWNMEANMYKDEESQVPDALKPAFDRIIAKIIHCLTGNDKDFYEREFSFFKAVTDISGKLKPLVQADATKADKKKKIDEEIRKIKVDPGVYLPTNPDRKVVDIDYDSGRPLQSHAKAPFMATFQVENFQSRPDTPQGAPEWMSSIFKVGDDCRQDVLALQLISVFQGIFQSAGLDLYTFPYRVVATAPGCGVIEVIPGSISRDSMGRENVNNLHEWFLAKFGSETSIQYLTAQKEFVKSLAAYSLIMFLLQFKDRHNGNIMFDKQGHMIHIDFGFMLSIAPGGGVLEVSPFKLTTEMILVMGGDATQPAYLEFSELCVRAYLASRPYAEEIISIVSLMMESGLPCFKGELTIRKLRERFQLDKTDHGAAEFMINCIKQSHQNTRQGLYDVFQSFQNGIPYHKG